MDKVVDKIVGLGVPGLVLLIAVSISGFSGAAALTAALASLGGTIRNDRRNRGIGNIIVHFKWN